MHSGSNTQQIDNQQPGNLLAGNENQHVEPINETALVPARSVQATTPTALGQNTAPPGPASTPAGVSTPSSIGPGRRPSIKLSPINTTQPAPRTWLDTTPFDWTYPLAPATVPMPGDPPPEGYPEDVLERESPGDGDGDDNGGLNGWEGSVVSSGGSASIPKRPPRRRRRDRRGDPDDDGSDSSDPDGDPDDDPDDVSDDEYDSGVDDTQSPSPVEDHQWDWQYAQHARFTPGLDEGDLPSPPHRRGDVRPRRSHDPYPHFESELDGGVDDNLRMPRPRWERRNGRERDHSPAPRGSCNQGHAPGGQPCRCRCWRCYRNSKSVAWQGRLCVLRRIYHHWSPSDDRPRMVTSPGPTEPAPPPIFDVPEGSVSTFHRTPTEVDDMILALVERRDASALRIALGQTPCTEGMPFDVGINRWTDGGCPHHRPDYRGVIRACANGSRCHYVRTQNPPPRGERVNQAWVCDRHQESNHRLWPPRKIIDSHRVGTCMYHRDRLRLRYRGGYNSCTCEANLFDWLCQACYGLRCEWLMRNFRHRVNRRPPPGSFQGRQGLVGTGGSARDVTGRDVTPPYYLNPARVRRTLVKFHPCGLGCGRRRANQTAVMDCRCCGGLIVKPWPGVRNPRIGYSLRGRVGARGKPQGGTLMMLNDRNKPVAQPDQGVAPLPGRTLRPRGARPNAQ